MFKYIYNIFYNSPVTKSTQTNFIVKKPINTDSEYEIAEKFIEINKYITYLLSEDIAIDYKKYSLLDTEFCHGECHNVEMSKHYRHNYPENEYNINLCTWCYLNYNFESNKHIRNFIKYIKKNYTIEEIEQIFNLNDQILY